MKRIAVILLLLIYTASVYGVTINKFYCCGKLASVSLSVSSVSKNVCKATSGSDCWEIVKTNFKVKDNHVSVKTDLKLKNSFALVIPVFLLPASAGIITLKEVKAYNSQSPPVQPDPLYILYSNYRI
ncbi:HYC_CC_PP family protein [Mucilaginibacter sp. SP1R1]|uniref:HYC_CC_PP family protein n=1 Tax=Mucilaginibacter sp. SP1R1 TaxID=2723091 RepID=UPI00160AE01F|nr:hypothetical protein [Mucilaginibacter sp. SP1R1]MBB6148895.1 hypothetical protein [Mucilaginibacter sp. SP1R1]